MVGQRSGRAALAIGSPQPKSANIETTFKRSDFGMNYGLPGIGDEVNVIAPVEAFKEIKTVENKSPT